MKRYFKFSLLMVLILLIAACSTKSVDVPSNSIASGDEGVLTVYLNDFDEIIGPMFEEATGYKINLVQGGGAELLSRIEAERGNPRWDVIWVDTISSVHGLGMNGQLNEEFTPSNASNLSESYNELVPEKRWYYPTGAHAAAVIVYNHSQISAEQAPASWQDFSNPLYNKTVGMADPTIAAPAYSLVNWFFQYYGMDEAKQLMSGWRDNGLMVFPKNPNVAMALLSGQINVAALQESNAYRLVNENKDLTIVWPEMGAPGSVRVAGISKETKNLEAAQAFINFILDPKTQQEIINSSDEPYHEPSVTGVKTREDRNPEAKLLFTDARSSYQQEAEIKQWFADFSIQ